MLMTIETLIAPAIFSAITFAGIFSVVRSRAAEIPIIRNRVSGLEAESAANSAAHSEILRSLSRIEGRLDICQCMRDEYLARRAENSSGRLQNR